MSFSVMVKIRFNLIFLLIVSASSEVVQIVEEIKNGTEIDGITKFLKTVIIHQSASFRIIEDNKLYQCLLIDPQTNSVKVKSRIDRESLCPMSDRCMLQLKFLIQPSYQSISLTIEIIDINDNPPSWPQRSKIINFIEFEGNKFESRSIQIDKATDPDTNENSRINYYLKEKDGVRKNQDFKIKYDSSNNRRIELSPIKIIDREKIDTYEMILIAEDNGNPKLTGTLEIIVNVLDKNDNGPTFDRPQYRNDGLSEKVQVGTVVLTVSATDLDSGNNGRITYRIDDQKASEYFNIDINGRLTVKKDLDYDAGIKSFIFNVLAIDEAPEEYRKTGECEVVITVKDENDEKPQILIHVTKRDPLTNEPAIIENEVTQNFVLAHIQVKDPDYGGTDRVSCTLNNNPKMRLEQVSSSDNEFQIIALVSFDREERHMEKVDITCKDQAQNTASKSINFQILDLNDNSPKFTRVFHFQVKENSTNSEMYVGEIIAFDKDAASNSKIEFQIMGHENQFFRIDQSGKMYTRKTLDREETEKFNLTILAKDGGIPPRTGTGLVIIDVIDVNDWKPQFNSSLYEFHINENASIGSIVGTVTATDRDLPGNTYMKYRINQDMNQKFSSRLPFQITRNSQGAIVTKYLLDREEQSIYMLTIIAIDSGHPNSFTSTTSVKVFIMDVNDNAPIFKTPNQTIFTMQMADSVGQAIGTILATDSDYGENSEVEYKLENLHISKYFTLNSRTGKLNLAHQLSKIDDHKLIITACDRGEPRQCSRPLWITIRISKSQIPHNPEIPNSDLITDSKTYIFIICVLVILLLIITVLIICAIIFRNRICYQLSPRSPNNSDINTDGTNRKLHSDMSINGKVQCTEPLMMNQQKNTIPHSNFDIQPRERQISAEYQSIEGGSPRFQLQPQFSWEHESMQQPINEILEPMYAVHRSTKDYYFPAGAHHYPLPQIIPYCYQGVPSPSYAFHMNNLPKDTQYTQDTFPRNQSPKRYNSLQNFQSASSLNPEFIYKSLKRENNKASYV